MVMNNRSVTLIGANLIFAEVTIISQDADLGFYFCEIQDETIQRKTLTALCQSIVAILIAS